jgi:NADH-quinone oxidoreductase subunit G
MPCVAKKAESELPTMRTEHGPDVDLVLTTRELVRMIRADKLDPAALPEEPMDEIMGTHTGAGVIFGATGGVMEAALRTAAYVLTGENPDPDAFWDVRTGPGLREVTYEIAGTPVRCAVVSGLGNARTLVEQLKAGKVQYDFVEVMACPGGCVGGGGQPIDREDQELYGPRGQRLYDLDKACQTRFSHENGQVNALYREFLGKPLSHLSETLLHTDHRGWSMPERQ